MSRQWIKVYCEGWCEGNIRKETSALRSAWVDVLAFVGGGKFSDAGELKISGEAGFTDKQIARMMNVPEDEWTAQKARLVETSRVEIFGDNCLRIVNWGKYQAQFWRGNKEKYGKIRKSLTTNENGLILTEIEKEKEIEIENKKEEGRDRRRRSASRSPSSVRFNFKTRAWEGITPEQESFWAKVYPGVNIQGELLRMAAWIDSNQDKAPVSRFGAFINRWLKSEQNKAASRRQGPWDNRPAWMKKVQDKT